MKNSRFKSYIKYFLIAIALKILSISPRIYRFLGNQFGAQKRVLRGIPATYGKRAKLFLSWYEKYQIIKKDDAVLEIGTGWVHFESIVIRLFYDVKATEKEIVTGNIDKLKVANTYKHKEKQPLNCERLRVVHRKL